MKVVNKPWGKEEWWAHTDKYVAKFLHINEGERLSLQYHVQKEETMYVLEGKVKFTIGEDTFNMEKGSVVHVKPGTVHRMQAIDGPAVIVEVSTPEVDDIVRLQDDYSR